LTTIKPGQSGTLKIATQMHKGMEGPHEFQITVKSNDTVNPVITLTFKGNFG